MAQVKDLYDFLQEAELQDYYNGFKNELRVNNVAQIKYVEDDDLADIGMSKPEIRRLKKFFRKECPQGALGKFKKVLSSATENRLGSFIHASEKPAPQHGKPPGHIISFEALSILKTLGSGEFGTVQQGIWTKDDGEKVQVAIKCLKKERLQTGMPDFLKEISLMHSVDHEHIVQLYGVVLESNSLMMVYELAPLRSLLECLKEPALRNSFPVLSLCAFALQVAGGMAYLESKNLIHRDLAARNILVFSRDKVKISDFGLSRAIGVGDDYYQCTASLKLPIAWCAPECIKYLKFTSASDVWAYGVTLWEMFTYGFQPWAAFTGNQIIEAIDEPSCQRLEQPDCCPKAFYSLMHRCWNLTPEERPTFAEITKTIPQIRPEQLQATQDSAQSSNPEYLHYRAHDVITVLHKHPEDCPRSGLWKGFLERNNHTGWFDPAETTPYVEIKTVSPMLRAKAKMSRRESGRKSLKNRASKIRADMISKPQNDLRHTGHIGYDGAVFGDVGFIGGNYDKLPVKVSSPYKGRENAGDSSEVDGVNPVHSSHSEMSLASSRISQTSSTLGVSTLSTTSSQNTLTDVSMFGDGDSMYRSNGHGSYDDLDDNGFLGDFKMPDFTSSLDLGPSFMDEVMKALSESTTSESASANEMQANSGVQLDSLNSYSSGPETRGGAVLTNGRSGTEPVTSNGDRSWMQSGQEDIGLDSSFSSQSSYGYSHKSSPGTTARDSQRWRMDQAAMEGGVPLAKEDDTTQSGRTTSTSRSSQPLPSKEQRELEEAIAIANNISAKKAAQSDASLLSPQSGDNCRGDSDSDNSPNNRSRFSLRKRSPKPEKMSYCDEIDRKSCVSEDMTPEAQEAYNILVATGTPETLGRERDRTRSNRERRRQRSLEHQQGDGGTIDRMRNVNMNIREPQGIPFRRATVDAGHSAADEEEDTNPLRRLRASQGRIPPPTKPKPKCRPPSGEYIDPSAIHSNTKPRPPSRPSSGEMDSLTSDTQPGSYQTTSRNENIRKPNLVPRSGFVSKFGGDPTPSNMSSNTNAISATDPSSDSPGVPPRKPLRPGTINNKPRERKYPLDLTGDCPVSNVNSIPVCPASNVNSIPAGDKELSHVDSSHSFSPPCNDNSVNECNDEPRGTSSPKPDNCGDEKSSKSAFPSLVNPAMFCVKSVRCNAQQMGLEDTEDAFWSRKVNFEEFQFDDDDTDIPTTVHYKTSDSVSYEDLMEFALDGDDKKRASKISRGSRPRSGDSLICDEIRLMRKVLTKDVTLEDCMMALEETKWEVHNAIKYLKLKQLMSTQLADMAACKQALTTCKWSVQEAANYLIANPPNQESPECINV